MTKQEAIAKMRQLARGIVPVATADELAQAFGFNGAEVLDVVQHREQGENWSTREEWYGEGNSVGIYQLAMAMARKLMPECHIDSSPYMGTGKSAAYCTYEATKVLEQVA